MKKYIDAEKLLDQASNWEAKALEEVEKHLHDEDRLEWIKWTAILGERTAFKFDVMNAHAEDVVVVRHGKWRCTVCGEAFLENEGKWNYCPNCGSKMEEQRMTREEAKDILQTIQRENWQYFDRPTKEALEMAIEALKQQKMGKWMEVEE